MDINATIILEGGGMRGVFTAGVLDFLMDNDYYFSDVIGVSAGSCNGIDYVSKQRGRSKNCFIITDNNNRFMHPGNFFLHRNVMDMEKMFVKFPTESFPFDFETFRKSNMKMEVVVTNCLNGKAEYKTLDKTKKLDNITICRASCSMPRFCKEVYLNNIPFLDGGVSDSIPLKHVVSENKNSKIFVVLTQPFGYRKKIVKTPIKKAIKLSFTKYPELLKVLVDRPNLYNNQLNYVEELEKKGKIFVIRPEMEVVNSLETKVEKLNDFYTHGYFLMKRDFTALNNFINN
ncbi:MAG: patatin family protein [Sphaerochaetaceae bacterium]